MINVIQGFPHTEKGICIYPLLKRSFQQAAHKSLLLYQHHYLCGQEIAALYSQYFVAIVQIYIYPAIRKMMQ